jgi:hypothetical protein
MDCTSLLIEEQIAMTLCPEIERQMQGSIHLNERDRQWCED